MACKDAKNNFIYDHLEINAFASNLDNHITELRHGIKTNTIQPHPCVSVEIPKTSLSIRFGSILSFKDSVILHAILYLIAPIIDRKISQSVYSYRLKDREKYEKSDEIFKESSQFDFPIPQKFLKIAENPYLKSKTISQKIDIFDPWYANWPEFDFKSKEAFQNDGYSFMAVTDIVSYFDNIHLSILNDVLLSFLPREQKIINLLLDFLKTWVCKTSHGGFADRGIPQGNQVSSFLGNIFLKDLDHAFDSFCSTHEARYFRYMDDVRIFTKTEMDARLALLTMNRILRQLHLNVQSSKTKILRESPSREISRSLLDDRFDSLNNFLQYPLPFSYRGLIKELLYKKSRYGEEAVLSKKRPLVALNSMNSRLFRRWASYCIKGKFPEYITRLEKEIRINPDPRITSVAVRTIKAFPRRTAFVSHLLEFIQSDINVFPQQEAEILKGARYLCKIPKALIIHCRHNIFQNGTKNFQVKLESLKLLMCVGLSKEDINTLKSSFSQEENIHFRAVLATAMFAGPNNIDQTLQNLLLHPNSYIRDIAQYMWQLQHSEQLAKKKLRFIFQGNNINLIKERIADNIAELWIMSKSKHVKVLQDLKKHIEKTGFLQKKYTLSFSLQIMFSIISKCCKS